MKLIAIAAVSAVLAGCGGGDANAKPEYGESGAAKNCRAYIAEAVSGARSGQYTPVDALEGIDRNCGAAGHLWAK